MARFAFFEVVLTIFCLELWGCCTRQDRQTNILTTEVMFTKELDEPTFFIALADDAKQGIINTSKAEPSHVYTDRGTSHTMYKLDVNSRDKISIEARFPGRCIIGSAITRNGRYIAFGLSDGSYHWWPFIDGSGDYWRKKKGVAKVIAGSRPESVIAIDDAEMSNYRRDFFAEHGADGKEFRLTLPYAPAVIKFDRNRELVVFNYGDGKAEIRRLPSYEVVQTCDPSNKYGRDFVFANDAEFSPDRRFLVLAGDRGMCIWDLENERIHAEVIDPDIFIMACRFTPDGRYLIVVQKKANGKSPENSPRFSRDSSLAVWDMTMSPPRLIGTLELQFNVLAMSPDGSTICFSHGKSGRLCTYARLHLNLPSPVDNNSR